LQAENDFLLQEGKKSVVRKS